MLHEQNLMAPYLEIYDQRQEISSDQEEAEKDDDTLADAHERRIQISGPLSQVAHVVTVRSSK